MRPSVRLSHQKNPHRNFKTAGQKYAINQPHQNRSVERVRTIYVGPEIKKLLQKKQQKNREPNAIFNI